MTIPFKPLWTMMNPHIGPAAPDSAARCSGKRPRKSRACSGSRPMCTWQTMEKTIGKAIGRWENCRKTRRKPWENGYFIHTHIFYTHIYIYIQQPMDSSTRVRNLNMSLWNVDFFGDIFSVGWWSFPIPSGNSYWTWQFVLSFPIPNGWFFIVFLYTFTRG